MKKIFCFALLFLLSTLAFSQCVPPPIYDSLGIPTGKTANGQPTLPPALTMRQTILVAATMPAARSLSALARI